MASHPLRWWLAACGGLAAAHLWLPALAQSASLLVLVTGLTALLFARGRREPIARPSWWLFAAGTGCWSVGLVLSILVEALEWQPYPSPTDLAYLAGYLLVAVGLLLLAPRRWRGPAHHVAVDTAIVVLGAAVFVWVVVLAPVGLPEVHRVTYLTTAAYPVLDLTLLVGVTLVVMSPGQKPRGVPLLFAAVVAGLTANLGFAWLEVRGLYWAGHPVALAWVVAFALFGAAALADTRAAPADQPRVTTTLPWRRSGGQLATLAVAALAAPVAIVVLALQRGDLVLGGLATAALLALALVLGRAVGLTRVVTAQARELAIQSTTDELTGVLNRRGLDERLAAEMAASVRSGRPLAVAMVDLDWFKAFNDEHGHVTGDELLAEVAGAWRSELRLGDVLARFGGDEFVIVLRDCDAALAREILDRVQSATPRGQSCSIGVAQFDGRETPGELLGRADAAVYAAKQAGRDRSVTAPVDLHSR